MNPPEIARSEDAAALEAFSSPWFIVLLSREFFPFCQDLLRILRALSAFAVDCAFPLQPLRVRARRGWHFGASTGWADARRGDAGDVVTSSRIPSEARDAPLRRRATAPMPSEQLQFAEYDSVGKGAGAKCQIILARALSTPSHKYDDVC